MCFECDDLLVPVHDSTVGVDGPPYDFIVVLEVDNDDLRFVFFVEFLPDANERVGFECLSGELAKLLSRSKGHSETYTCVETNRGRL